MGIFQQEVRDCDIFQLDRVMKLVLQWQKIDNLMNVLSLMKTVVSLMMNVPSLTMHVLSPMTSYVPA